MEIVVETVLCARGVGRVPLFGRWMPSSGLRDQRPRSRLRGGRRRAGGAGCWAPRGARRPVGGAGCYGAARRRAAGAWDPAPPCRAMGAGSRDRSPQPTISAVAARVEDQAAVGLGVDHDRVAVVVRALQQLERDRVGDLASAARASAGGRRSRGRSRPARSTCARRVGELEAEPARRAAARRAARPGCRRSARCRLPTAGGTRRSRRRG